MLRLLLLTEWLEIRLCVTSLSEFVRQLPVILVSTLPAQCLPSIRLLVIHRLLRIGECALFLLREGTFQVQVEVLIRMVALVVERRLVLHLVVVVHRVVDVVRAGVLHLAVDVVPQRHSALLPDQRRTNGEPTIRKDHQ